MASRDPYVSWGDARDLGSLLRLVTRYDYGGPFRASRAPVQGQLLERLDVLAAATGTSFGAAGTLLAVAGAASAWMRERRIAIALLLGVLFTGPLFAAADAVDIHSGTASRSSSASAACVRFRWRSSAALVPRAIAWFRSHAPWPGRPVRLGVAALTAVTLGRSRRISRARHEPRPPGKSLMLTIWFSRLPTARYSCSRAIAEPGRLYVCGVEQRCGSRIVIHRAALHAVEKASARCAIRSSRSRPKAVDRRRRAPRRTGLDRRAVFVTAELLDDALSGEKAALPSGLLFESTRERAVAARRPTDLAGISRRWRAKNAAIPSGLQRRRWFDAGRGRAPARPAGGPGLRSGAACPRDRGAPSLASSRRAKPCERDLTGRAFRSPRPILHDVASLHRSLGVSMPFSCVKSSEMSAKLRMRSYPLNSPESFSSSSLIFALTFASTRRSSIFLSPIP